MPMAAHGAIRTTAATLLPILVAAGALGCGGSNADLKAARSSGYKADFALVFNQVVAAVRGRFKNYPDKVEENAATGTVETAWFPVKQTTGSVDHTTSQQARDLQAAEDRAAGTGPGALGGINQERSTYFIRYQVYVTGGNPWRVIVRGQASRWNAGDAQAVELKGADAPPWLAGRVESLEVDIYRRLQKYAVPVQVAPTGDTRPPPAPADLARYGKIPRAAAERIEEVRRAAADRDFTRLRAMMIDDLEWSLGAPPSADQAIAMWQADGGSLPSLVSVLERGCRGESPTRVSCPPEFSEQVGYLGHRAVFELRGDTWKMTSFVSGE